ncbi:MAG: hypothetical protein BMS9Abin11_1496 [Gammaproteobacteria bacterium]|nr:MAG: hypothetical protein BMS9Abin11_1496 [Gammaproteobacteria bacterium]
MRRAQILRRRHGMRKEIPTPYYFRKTMTRIFARSRRPLRLAIISLALGLTSGGFVPAQAAGPIRVDWGEAKLDFALRLSRYKTTFDYGTLDIRSTLEEITTSWRYRISKRLQVGFVAGYSSLSQRDNPPTAGLDLNGWHAGVGLHFNLFHSKYVDLVFSTDYTFNDLSGDATNSDSVDIEWAKSRALIGLTVRAGKRVQLYGGSIYNRIDGEQRQTGTVNQTLDFKQDRTSGAFVGLDINLERQGFFGVEIQSGETKGIGFYFKRFF